MARKRESLWAAYSFSKLLLPVAIFGPAIPLLYATSTFKHEYRKHGYRYRWMRDPGNSSGSKRCIVASCTETSSIIHTGIVTKEKIRNFTRGDARR